MAPCRSQTATSTVYHPQTDGQTERVNQELEQFIRIFTNYQQDDWDDLLPAAEFAYNNHVHSSTQQVPFMTDTGRVPRMGFEPTVVRSGLEEANEFRDRIALGVSEAKAALVKAKEEYKRYYDRKRTPAPDIKVGDNVWLDASDIRTTRPSLKFSHRRLGPFKVIKVVGNGTFKLELPPRFSRLHPVFPVVKLELAQDDQEPGRPRNDEPPPELEDGHEEWEIEAVLDSEVRYRRVWYWVHWRGYGPQYDCWIRHDRIFADDLIADFHRRYPDKPRPDRDNTIHRVQTLRRDAAIQGGGDVRGTRPFAARDAPAARDSASRATTYARPPPSRPLLPLAPSAPPSEPSEVDPSELVRSSRVALGRRPLGSYAYHAACDQADAICRAQRRARDYPGLID